MSDLHNVEAEQSVLGLILLSNDALDRIPWLEPAHFYDPVHARVFEMIRAHAADGQTASPTTLKFLLGDDAGLAQLGGPAYLARLAAAAGGLSAIADTAKVLRHLAARRALAGALDEAGARVEAGDGGTIREIVTSLEARLVAAVEADGAKPVSRSLMSSMGSAITQANEAYQGDQLPGVSSGLRGLDKAIGSMRPGRVYLLAGRPSMGKTAVALNIALKAADAGAGVIIGSFEMTEEDLANRALSQMLRERGTRLPYNDLERGNLDEGQFRELIDCARANQNRPIQIIAREHNELSRLMLAIRGTAKTIAAPLGLVVIDYLQLVQVDGAKSFDRISAVSKAIKGLAMSLNVPILLLSQLNRQVEARDDKRPRLDDLRGSGEIEEDADTVLMVYRDEYYAERAERPKRDDELGEWHQRKERARNKLEIIVAKNRGGPIMTVHARCEVEHNFICDPEDYESEAAARASQMAIDFA